MIDELVPSDQDNSEDDQKAQIFDWTGLAIDIQNVFILVAFNPIAVQGSNAKMKVKCPGAGIDNFKDEDIEEILNKCEKSRAMWQQLQVSYRCALPIAKLADFFKSHETGKINFLNFSSCIFPLTLPLAIVQ